MGEPSSYPHPTELTEDDVFTAWEVISSAGHSVLTKSQVLDSLRMFNPHITARDVKTLVGPGNLSTDKLRDLLFNTEVEKTDMTDANWEAFKLIDPHGTGYVEINMLRKLLMQLPGVGLLNDDDMRFLSNLADVDGDGRINFRDFAQIGSWAPEIEVPSEAVRKMVVEKLQAEAFGK